MHPEGEEYQIYKDAQLLHKARKLEQMGVDLNHHRDLYEEAGHDTKDKKKTTEYVEWLMKNQESIAKKDEPEKVSPIDFRHKLVDFLMYKPSSKILVYLFLQNSEKLEICQ